MSILSIYEAKQKAISKFKATKTYLQRLATSKVQSTLVSQATEVDPLKMSSVTGKDSDYNRDVIKKYLN
jgi:hypothetical protein